MGKTFNGDINFPSNLNVQVTKPLDSRLVVDSISDLTNGSITAPYQGMVVSIKGTSELWILKTQGIEESHNINNWGKVTGSGSGSGSGLSGYSVPMMTPEMVINATADPDVDFDESEDPYVLLDYDAQSLVGETTNNTITSLNGTYLDIMLRAIRDLQAEVAMLKNSFTYGIDSYKDTKTAKSVLLGEYDNVTTDEPLWAIDPGYLSLVADSSVFNTYLDSNHSFVKYGDCSIDVSTEGQLTFNNGKGVFYDGQLPESKDTSFSERKDLTLYNLSDSKLIIYLVTDKPTITMNLVSLDDKTSTKTVDFKPLMNGNTVNKYGFCIVVSRKVSSTSGTTTTYKGFNYIYFSIINYESDEKLYEGYLNSSGGLSSTRVEVSDRYSIDNISFDRLTLTRMKFYTKYEDFSDEVISSAPSESDYKYEVAHITIRSVENATVLESIKDQLKDNELIWNKGNNTLNIKSNNKICRIGNNSGTDDEDDNNDNNMTNKEIITALKNMGLVINVTYVKDDSGNDTDVIASVSDMSLSPISDFTFVNGDTGKKFTFTVDNEGNLVGKDKSAQTIEEFVEGLIESNRPNYDASNYQAVRGFSSDYFFRKSGKYTLASGVNVQSDAGKNSDRLRISSFYAPIESDTTHGCTHSFIELENTSDKDFPLTGVYLHFYNPVGVYNSTTDTYSGKVYHLALDGSVPAGGTYLIRGAKHAEFEDQSAFIKVKSYDKEWYYDKELLSFEQMKVLTNDDNTAVIEGNKVTGAYRFCLTYGLPELDAETQMGSIASTTTYDINGVSFDNTNYPSIITNPRFIDSCSFSTFGTYASQTGTNNPWYINGSGGVGIVIKENTMFRLMFALDPAKQAFNGFNIKDGSRARYNKDQDLQVLKLDKEFIGFPNSTETIKIERYTPKASFENRNVMTDKTQLDGEKPNMVTCSFGNDVYNTRCFNWISCGTFDEYLWVRKQGETSWTSFQSYTTVSSDVTEGSDSIHRKEYSMTVNNAAYARIIDRFPGNNVLFTSHKCVIVLPDASEPTVYEYVVGRPDKDGNPDSLHINDTYTFTLYPRTYEGRVYQITDQQGFHWIEYQVWAASAEFLNTQISTECSGKSVFPILLNTGDMTQSGARINEWLDYYNGGKCLFNHMEQMNCVGNNDLCPVSPNELGTGNDSNKSNSRFFHYFYCFDVKDSERYEYYNGNSESDDDFVKFFSGDSLVVKAHTGTVTVDGADKSINITEDRYIPSFYYFKTSNIMYIVINSEIPAAGIQSWFGLCSANKKYVNIYTGIDMCDKGNYDSTIDYFTPLYETMYAWLNDNKNNGNKKVVVAMHEMPFTVITQESLINSNKTFLTATRNFPNGKTSRVGSNVNQLQLDENRGIFWMSRLLEYFGCKLVIGGHKHTYALSYPIKEKYSWTYDGTTKDSMSQIKPMFATLADEAGETPEYTINWLMDYDSENPYNISDGLTRADDKKLNSTKTPYIPKELYDLYVTSSSFGDRVRCCTPVTVSDDKYDGYISYSMCQATGYKLKSNKELPSALQVFSKVIPQTTYKYSGTDVTKSTPSGEQLYPMYSVLEFNSDCSELDVKMIRITNIFAMNGKDTFTQSDYGKSAPSIQYLCTKSGSMYGQWLTTEDSNNKYLHIKF